MPVQFFCFVFLWNSDYAEWNKWQYLEKKRRQQSKCQIRTALSFRINKLIFWASFKIQTYYIFEQTAVLYSHWQTPYLVKYTPAPTLTDTRSSDYACWCCHLCVPYDSQQRANWCYHLTRNFVINWSFSENASVVSCRTIKAASYGGGAHSCGIYRDNDQDMDTQDGRQQ